MSHRVRDHRARSLGREGLQVTDEAHHVRVTGDSVQVLTVPGLESPQQQPCSLQYSSHEKAMSATATQADAAVRQPPQLAGVSDDVASMNEVAQDVVLHRSPAY